MDAEFVSVAEEQPGSRWASLFRQFWPAYRKWFLRGGLDGRPSREESEEALRLCMPELIPTYESLVDLSGNDDLAARCLSLYCPPTYLAGCSQAAWTRDGARILVRNYDYSPLLWEGVLLRSRWRREAVISTVDCLWGALDGLNESGLAASLSFGGSRAVGRGFGIPLILRYVLETCSSTRQAVEVLQRIPSHMAYNVTVLDRDGATATVLLGPDRPPGVSTAAVSTNHQEVVRWKAYVDATGSRTRERLLRQRLGDADVSRDEFIRGFLERPVYSSRHRRGWGTLYTAAYDAANGVASFYWPRRRRLDFGLTDFPELTRTLRFSADDAPHRSGPAETTANERTKEDAE